MEKILKQFFKEANSYQSIDPTCFDLDEFTETWLKDNKKQLNLGEVNRSKRVNIITFENNTRCFKLNEKELLNMIKKNRLEKGDIHYKCELVRKY